jgi:antitoxin ParD1/3/4
MGKPTSNVRLTPELVAFVDEQVSTGSFSSSSEVHRAALVAMKKAEEERQARIARLKGEIQKGIDSIDAGQGIEINSPEELREQINGSLDKARENLKAKGVEIAS